MDSWWSLLHKTVSEEGKEEGRRKEEGMKRGIEGKVKCRLGPSFQLLFKLLRYYLAYCHVSKSMNSWLTASTKTLTNLYIEYERPLAIA